MSNDNDTTSQERPNKAVIEYANKQLRDELEHIKNIRVTRVFSSSDDSRGHPNSGNCPTCGKHVLFGSRCCGLLMTWEYMTGGDCLTCGKTIGWGDVCHNKSPRNETIYCLCRHCKRKVPIGENCCGVYAFLRDEDEDGGALIDDKYLA
jgi:hypothetical protein